MILKRFDASSIAHYVYIWYDYEVEKAYNQYNKNENKDNKEGLDSNGRKTPALRNKYSRIKMIKKIVLEVSNTLTVPEKPDNVEDYEVWRNQIKGISELATDKMFRSFQHSGLLSSKTKSVADLTESSTRIMYQKWKKEKKDIHLDDV